MSSLSSRTSSCFRNVMNVGARVYRPPSRSSGMGKGLNVEAGVSCLSSRPFASKGVLVCRSYEVERRLEQSNLLAS